MSLDILKNMKKFKLSYAFILFIITGLLLNLNKLIFSTIFYIGIHELGHLFVIKLLKYDIYKIHILPFGFMIECNLNTNRSICSEIIVYIAGILVNIIAILIIIIFKLDNYFIKINLSIILFNIIPIIPLDGGRILLSILCTKIRYKKALIISNIISIILIIILMSIGVLFKNINLLLMDLYLFFYNVKNIKAYKKMVNEFLLGKYLYPNYYLKYHYVNVKEIGIENNYLKGKNNIINIKNKNYYESDILRKKYKDRNYLS